MTWSYFAFLLIIASRESLLRSDRDIASIENEQHLLLQKLTHSKESIEDLRERLESLNKRSNLSKTLNLSSTVAHPEDEDGEVVPSAPIYTPPIIIMLPEDTTGRDKWEYALTVKCLGNEDFDAFTNIHNKKIFEMIAMKGKTVSEIQEEIKETEKELEKTKKLMSDFEKTEITEKGEFKQKRAKLMKEHRIKLLKSEVDLLTTKLIRLDKRLKSAILFGKDSSKKNYEHNRDGEQYGNKEDYKEEDSDRDEEESLDDDADYEDD